MVARNLQLIVPVLRAMPVPSMSHKNLVNRWPNNFELLRMRRVPKIQESLGHQVLSYP